MASLPLPSQERLRQVFDYDPETGVLIWKPRPQSEFKDFRMWRSWSGRHEGKPVLPSFDSKGYGRVRLAGVGYKIHRIMWKWVRGTDPDQIDHINGDRYDNRIVNMREVDDAENHRNMQLRGDNVTGYPGVHWLRRERLWMAQIHVDGQRIKLGYFHDKADAVSARKNAERKYGFHENHGRAAPLSA